MIGADLASEANGTGMQFSPPGVGFGGGMATGTSWNGTPIYLPNPGLAGALGLPTMADVGGPIMNATKGDDVITTALGFNRLVPCTSMFFGSNFKFIRENLPHIDATKTLGGAAIGRTDQSMVPDVGRTTIKIDSGSYSSMKPQGLAITYLHEAANAFGRTYPYIRICQRALSRRNAVETCGLLKPVCDRTLQ